MTENKSASSAEFGSVFSVSSRCCSWFVLGIDDEEGQGRIGCKRPQTTTKPISFVSNETSTYHMHLSIKGRVV